MLPAGKTIRELSSRFDVIEVEIQREADETTGVASVCVHYNQAQKENAEKCKAYVKAMTRDAKVGDVLKQCKVRHQGFVFLYSTLVLHM
jgi:hypothetical protein